MRNKEVFRNTLSTVAVGLLAGFLAAPQAQAHYRDFTLSRDWFLPSPNEKEVESRTTWDQKYSTVDQEFEFEYGVNQHFAIEPGIAYHKESGTNLNYDGYVTELRFNAGNFQTGKVLPALNMEYEHHKDEDAHGELKFVASIYEKDGSDFSANYNVGRSVEKARGWESEFTLGYVRPLGKSQPVVNGASLHQNGPRGGLEYSHKIQSGNDILGPVLVLRAGEHMNFAACYAFAINHRDVNGNQLNVIGEYEF